LGVGNVTSPNSDYHQFNTIGFCCLISGKKGDFDKEKKQLEESRI